MLDPFDLLGVTPDATPAEIRAAWRRRAYETHPDRGGDLELFRRVKEAYADLSDPIRRRAHELRRRGPLAPA